MDRELYLAATTGDNDAIIALQGKINQVTSEGEHTVLHLAAMCDKSRTVDAILNEHLDLLTQLNSKLETALHIAARKGYLSVVRSLINNSKRFVSPNVIIDFIRKANVDGNTALHFAAQNNHREVVELILEADSRDEHPLNKKYESPLYLAALMGSNDVTESILNTCQDAHVDGPDGKTILHAAVISRNADCVKLILQKKGHLVDRADIRGFTALHCAASHNCVSLLQIIEHNQPTRYQDDQKETTPLHVAASKGHISAVQELMRVYRSHPSNNSAICAAVNEDQQNILHIAVSQNHKELVKCILDECPDIEKLLNQGDKDGNTPFHLLVKGGCFSPELIKHPLLRTVLRRAKNNDKFTPADLLYFDEDIVGEQLQIKEELEDIQNDKRRNIWGGRSGPEISTSTEVPTSKRSRKDIKFKIEKAKQMEEKVKLYRERTGTQIIVTALITTVTFTVGFTMPGGYHQEEGKSNQGTSVLSRKTAFVICMVVDAIALLCSTTSLFFYFISSLYQDPHPVSILNAASVVLNIVSLVAMMGTFMAGTFVVLTNTRPLAIIILVIPAIFLPCLGILLRWLYDRRPVTKQHQV